MKKYLAAILFVLLATVGHAADKDGKFAIKGIGNTSCDNFLTLSETDSIDKFLYAGWINGYLTAQNQHLKTTFDLTSWETIHTLGGYLRNYCKKNPERSFYIAVASMIHSLFEVRLQESSAVEDIGVGKNTVLIYQASLARAQKKLKKLGLYKGEIDGKHGEKMKEAIVAFQKQRKLAVTGIPDQQTLHALLVEN